MHNRTCKKVYSLPVFLFLLIAISGCGTRGAQQQADQSNMLLGAYYFDGWTEGSYHITDKLTRQYRDREPVWGWMTSSQKAVDGQIKAAADAGIGFFAFDWYFKKGSDDFPLNHALQLYRSSSQKERLQFCLMVANHRPYFVGPDHWAAACAIWLKLFKDESYLKIADKPLLIFFSTASLVQEFGSPAAVKTAFDQLKAAAVQAGHKGVSLAACIYNNPKEIQQAEACGFDVLTGYNYHGAGFVKDQEVTPIDSMQTAEVRAWTGIADKSRLPYMPCITLNWDPRPWRPDTVTVQRFSGFSQASVYRSVHNAAQWMQAHVAENPKERIAIMYAWNENGEGGWLTPSKTVGDSLLMGVRQALKE